MAPKKKTSGGGGQPNILSYFNSAAATSSAVPPPPIQSNQPVPAVSSTSTASSLPAASAQSNVSLVNTTVATTTVMPSPSVAGISTYYNEEYQLLICSACEAAVADDIYGHFRNRHMLKRAETDILLRCIRGRHIVQKSNFKQPLARSPAIPGLPVHKGWRCMVDGCGFAVPGRKQAEKHRMIHGGAKKGATIEECHVQNVFNGIPKFCFAIIEQEDVVDLVYNADLNVIICSACKGSVEKSIEYHMQTKHNTINPAPYISQFRDISPVMSVEDIQYPDGIILQIDALNAPQQRYKCSLCSFTSMYTHKVNEHFESEHKDLLDGGMVARFYQELSNIPQRAVAWFEVSSATLLYNAEFRIMVCTGCGAGLSEAAKNHLMNVHNMDVENALRLIQQSDCKELAKPAAVISPSSEHAPIPGIEISEGYKCSACPFVSLDLVAADQHSETDHSTENVKIDACPVQTIFTNPELVKYFPVNASRSNFITSHQPVISRQQQAFSADLSALKQSKYNSQWQRATYLSIPKPRNRSALWYLGYTTTRAGESIPVLTGILAVAAFHLVSQSKPDTRSTKIRSQHLAIANAFDKQHQDSIVVLIADAGVEAIIRELGCVLHFCHWIFKSVMMESVLDHFEQLIILIEASRVAERDLHDDPRLHHIYSMKGRQLTEGGFIVDIDAADLDEMPTNRVDDKMVNHLSNLHQKILTRLNRPLDDPDDEHCFRAIADLRQCYLDSFASGSPEIVWDEFKTWTGGLSSHFKQMIFEQKDSVALLILAHGVLLLDQVDRITWFIGDYPVDLRIYIKDVLESRNSPLLDILAELDEISGVDMTDVEDDASDISEEGDSESGGDD